MYILGINAFHADSAAALFKDGDLVCAIEEEQIRRIKHWAGFPVEAIRYCLAAEKIAIDQIDHLAVSRNPKAHFREKVFYAMTHGFRLSSIKNRMTNQKKVSSVESLLNEAFSSSGREIRGQIHLVEHHRSHLGSSFFVSPFDKSDLVSEKGSGVSLNYNLWIENSFKKIAVMVLLIKLGQWRKNERRGAFKTHNC